MADNRKILIYLQFWEGDKAKAMETARLIADLEPRHSDLADFVFISRFDCPLDPESIKYMGRKFDTTGYQAKFFRGDGWPHGPNTLWFAAMDHAYQFSPSGSPARYKAILTMEADGYPMQSNWLRTLSDEWDRLHGAGANMVGSLQIYPSRHINGNCLITTDFEWIHWISRKVSGCTPTGGWDWVLRQDFEKRGWADTRIMRSYWASPTMNQGFYDQMITEGVVFLHGVKDSSVIRHVRNKFLPGT